MLFAASVIPQSRQVVEVEETGEVWDHPEEAQVVEEVRAIQVWVVEAAGLDQVEEVLYS